MNRMLWGILLLIPSFFVYGEPTVIDSWNEIHAPAAPELKPVKVDPATTALLLLDFQDQTVSPRPRALAAVPRVKVLLESARAAHVLVAYSATPTGSREAILPALQPLPEEHVVKSGVDKFFGTDLEPFLKDKGIKQVIITGTATEGAVLATSIGSALRGFKVVVPVDGTGSAEIYAEQYVAWHLMNAPAVKGNVTLTRTDWISF